MTKSHEGPRQTDQSAAKQRRQSPETKASPKPRQPADSARADTPPPQDPDAARRAAQQQAMGQAEDLRQAVIPAFLSLALNQGPRLGAAGVKAYLDDLMHAAGDPADPIERMLIEQLAMVHFITARLHADAAAAKGAVAAKMYNASASRMLGEFRRLALAVRVYRTPVGKPHHLRLAETG